MAVRCRALVLTALVLLAGAAPALAAASSKTDPGREDIPRRTRPPACRAYCDFEVVLSEVRYDEATDQQEFVEILAARGPANLTGWKLTDGENETVTFSGADPRFPCPEPFVLGAGDRLMVWQGSGTPQCTGSVRRIYLSRTPFLPAAGDDLTLRDADGACRDHVRFESGAQVGARPADCAWSGSAPTNGNTPGTSLSRFDGSPLTDTDSASDWEASGFTTTVGPSTPGEPNESTADGDGDGIPDSRDNCVSVPNPGQADGDADAVGNLCDNCPARANPQQANSDGDAVGDACDDCPLDADNDADGDDVCANADLCPDVPDPDQTDTDGDAVGNACDDCPADPANDGDGDGVCGNVDNCPTVANTGQADADGDGVGDACDSGLRAVTIRIMEQDIRSDRSDWAQHRQQPVTRLGRSSTAAVYRSLGWLDLSSIPSGAVIDDVVLVYWTTSGDPQDVDPNGDLASDPGTITVELRKVLRPWNYDEPLTYPPSLTDNDVTVRSGETSWRHSLHPLTWEVPGAMGPADSAPVAQVGTVPPAPDTRVELDAPALRPLVQSWVDVRSSNHGFLLKATAANEASVTANRKILCGKGFPLETSTTLDPATAESHRPVARITYHLP